MALAVLGPAGPAAAVPTTCPNTGAPSGTVTVADPPPGAGVNGPVTVKGSAASPAGIARVELFVGDTLKDVQTFDPPRPTADLALRWDASEAPAGPAALTVVVCGAVPPRVLQAGRVDVTVTAPAAPPPTGPRLARAIPQDGPGTGPPWVGAAFAAGGIAALLAVTASRRRRAPASG